MWERFVDGLIAKQIQPGYTILDAGMGIGLLGFTTKLLHYEKAFHLYGCDVWKEGIKVAQDMGNA